GGMRGPVTKGLFLSVLSILALQTAGSHMLSIPERDIPIPELKRLPSEVGEWKGGSDQLLESNIEEYLKPDDYIIRDYANRRDRNESFCCALQVPSGQLRTPLTTCLPAGVGMDGRVLKDRIPSGRWKSRADSGERVRDGEVGRAHFSHLLVSEQPRCLGRRVS